MTDTEKPKSCATCRWRIDITNGEGSPHNGEDARYWCRAPALRFHLETQIIDGKKHQNSMLEANASRDVSILCGLEARWHVPVLPAPNPFVPTPENKQSS